MVKAIDSAGLESVNAAKLQTGLGREIFNVLLEEDEHAGGFTGNITNGTVNGGTGDLEADLETTDLMWFVVDLDRGDDRIISPPIWTNDPDHLMWGSNKYLPMEYTWIVSIPSESVPSSLTLSAEIEASAYFLEYAKDVGFWTGVDATVFWTSDTAMFWTFVESSSAVAFPGELRIDTARTIQMFAKIQPGWTRGVIKALTATVDVPGIVDVGEDFQIIAGGPTRLPLTKTFRVITQVHVSIENDGTDAVSWRWDDKNVTLGPQISLFAEDGTPSSDAHVDYQIVGY